MITLSPGIGVTLFAVLLPAFNASRVTPLEALFPAMNEGSQSVKNTPALVKPIATVFSSQIACIFAREGPASLAQGNLTRQPTLPQSAHQVD